MANSNQFLTPQKIGKMLVEPLNYAIAEGSRTALKVGVPARDIIEMHLNHLASIVAMIEPAGVREQTVMDIISSINPLVAKHVQARMGALIPATQAELQLHG